MKFRGLDANGDWMLGQGLGSYARDQAAIALDIQTRIKSWRGNCFFASQDGIDWRNRLDKGQKDNLLLELGNCIMQTQGVIKINSVDAVFDPKTRAITVTYNVDTIYTRSFKQTIDNIAGVTS